MIKGKGKGTAGKPPKIVPGRLREEAEKLKKIKIPKTMIANAHPVEGGRRTKRRQKTRYRAKTIKNPKKKRRTHRKKRNTQTMKNKRNRQLV